MQDLLDDGKAPEGGVLDGYSALHISEAACTPALADDMRGIMAARWLADTMRNDFETACLGMPSYGSTGNFDGIVADSMPSYWRQSGETAAGRPIWQADARHPVGKWFADIAARLLPLPPPEVVHAVLRRHGIDGSRYPAPQMDHIEGGWVVLLHGAKGYKSVSGVRREDSLMARFVRPQG
jgi:hypothetical protein